jgi:hypothetical protein
MKMRKRLFTLTIVLFSSINFLSAQITFQKIYGGQNNWFGESIQLTTDGGYIIVGGVYDSALSNYNIYLIKADSNGNLQWTKTFDITNNDKAYTVQQTTDGGYIITGHSFSFGFSIGGVFLIKTDVNGNLLWSKSLSAISDYGYCVQQTIDGGYIVAGITSVSGIGYETYLVKTDTNGDTLWTKIIRDAGNTQGYSIQQTNDGGYIVAGETIGQFFFDINVIKTDNNGNVLWMKNYGGAGQDAGCSIQQTMDGGFVIIGVAQSFGVGSDDVYLIKTDTSGNVLWSKTYGGTGNDDGRSVQQTMDGGYILTGWTNSFGTGTINTFLIKTDSNGDTLWTKTYGKAYPDGNFTVQQTIDGGYIIACTSSFPQGGNGIYLIKTDANGNSGCNEANPSFIVTTPITQVTNPIIIVSSGGTMTTLSPIVGGGGTDTTLCTTVGIKEIESNNFFTVFPNPASSNFVISFEKAIMKGNVEVLNILGENIFAENIINETKKEIKLNNISDGIYFVKMFDGDKSYCKKLIVEHD